MNSQWKCLSDTFHYLDILNLYLQGDKTIVNTFKKINLFQVFSSFSYFQLLKKPSFLKLDSSSTLSAKAPNAMPGFLIKRKNSSADKQQDFHQF